MAKTKRPNFLWISFEDCNPTYCCYGDPIARTPNLDRLAAQGCRWTHAFSTSGVCAPARCAVITGMYAISIGGHHMRSELHDWLKTPELPASYSIVPPAYVKCFTEYLRAEGYYCTNNTKTDYQFDPPRTAWDELGPEAHWRNRPDPSQPFFAVFNLGETHESGMWPGNCPQPAFDPARIPVPPLFPDTPVVREALARMYTHIESNDHRLGQLLSELEENGLAEETIVFHWSDHGPLPRGKRWPYDAGIHVPLIVRAPGLLKPGSVCYDLVSTVDLGPTVLSLAGIPIPRHMQGQAFLGPQAAPPREYVYATRDRHDESYDRVRAVRDRRFKYIRNYHPELSYVPWVPYLDRHPIMQELWRLHLEGLLAGPQRRLFEPRPPEELYDTESDPWELNNLAAKSAYGAELKRLRDALDHWLAEVGDMGTIPESEMVRRWYPEGKQPRTAPPMFIPVTSAGPHLQPVNAGTFTAPLLVRIYSPTQGASIAYTLEPGPHPRWKLYTFPLQFHAGTFTLRAIATRIGYQESPEVAATFTVRPRAE
ncbi:MAG: sulfatase-like hydrolase/transferase [Kiritimatiellia bacterium]